ncbi:YslB family protein [Ectobacillus sp. sgz5001026]|uniref:YslB family protein n=1 Tax=Ectobacillus sp. sgz5001026 TaxID=3242473 RepID=UPI0036D40307
MSKLVTQDELNNIPIHPLAVQLLRDDLIPDLLGKEADRILYWAGKSLVQRYPLETIEDIITFFDKACWGTLTVSEQKKNEMHFQLMSPFISDRYQKKQSTTYQLEAGFLAGQIQKQRGVTAETYEDQKKRTEKVQFIVQWDPKDILDAEI